MTKGRNSWQVTLRLPDSIRAELDKRAEKRGESITQYLQNCILRSARTIEVEPSGMVQENSQAQSHSGRTIAPERSEEVRESNHAQGQSERTIKPTKAELQAMIHRIEKGTPPIHPPFISRNDIPWYNQETHTTGDTVRMKDPKTGAIKEVTL